MFRNSNLIRQIIATVFFTAKTSTMVGTCSNPEPSLPEAEPVLADSADPGDAEVVAHPVEEEESMANTKHTGPEAKAAAKGKGKGNKSSAANNKRGAPSLPTRTQKKPKPAAKKTRGKPEAFAGKKREELNQNETSNQRRMHFFLVPL